MSWVIDIRHRLDKNGLPAVGGSIGNQAQHFGRIAAAGSAHRTQAAFYSPIVCRRRPARRRCQGRVYIDRHKDNVIEYLCPVCRDRGFVHGWQGTCWDMAGLVDYEDAGNIYSTITPEEYEQGTKIPTLSMETEAILHAGVFEEDCIVLAGCLESMGLLADEVAAEANHTRSPKAQGILDSLWGRLECSLAAE